MRTCMLRAARKVVLCSAAHCCSQESGPTQAPLAELVMWQALQVQHRLPRQVVRDLEWDLLVPQLQQLLLRHLGQTPYHWIWIGQEQNSLHEVGEYQNIVFVYL